MAVARLVGAKGDLVKEGESGILAIFDDSGLVSCDLETRSHLEHKARPTRVNGRCSLGVPK